jgi:hypothetical protein
MNDYHPSFLIFSAELGQLLGHARKYKDDAILIKKSTNTCSPSFHLLSSLAFELFPKLLIGYDVCLKYKDKNKEEISDVIIRKEIADGMRHFEHNIAKLYNHFPDLMRELNIKSIKKFQNPYIWEYRVILNGSDYEIGIKDVEAARYGPFANNMDILTDCTGDYIILNLLNEIEDYVSQKKAATGVELKKYLPQNMLRIRRPI